MHEVMSLRLGTDLLSRLRRSPPLLYDYRIAVMRAEQQKLQVMLTCSCLQSSELNNHGSNKLLVSVCQASGCYISLTLEVFCPKKNF